ncbi:uncharacterized protein LOC122870207 isoform X1 [Siniperca chuatsi]|uniref:uncharacterized protein LOC122870207 isoform X1 n=1 Tax=Siniperca chuatsi TaxID=119488 RepID=UPI001CE043E9|nr:uncharacterized protein LOC122870207 isoform X1 [Siniperca chuatsi]
MSPSRGLVLQFCRRKDCFLGPLGKGKCSLCRPVQCGVIKGTLSYFHRSFRCTPGSDEVSTNNKAAGSLSNETIQQQQLSWGSLRGSRIILKPDPPQKQLHVPSNSSRDSGPRLHVIFTLFPAYQNAENKVLREKMTCSILLLITLTSCVCGSFPPAAGTFVVNVTQSSYQAEENEDITLEWTFTTKPDSSNSLYIYCELITDLKASVLYHLQEGVEVPESQDGQFAVRVQCDRDVLREGQLRLHVSRLRTEDSGLYQCEVSTTYGGSVGKSRLTVTAAADEPKPQRPTVRPQPESRGRIGLCAGLGLTAAALLAVSAGLCFAFGLCFTKSTDKRGNVSAAVYRC